MTEPELAWDEISSVWVAALGHTPGMFVFEEQCNADAEADEWNERLTGMGLWPGVKAVELVPAARLAKLESELARFRAMEAAMRDRTSHIEQVQKRFGWTRNEGEEAGVLRSYLAMLQEPSP